MDGAVPGVGVRRLRARVRLAIGDLGIRRGQAERKRLQSELTLIGRYWGTTGARVEGAPIIEANSLSDRPGDIFGP